MHTRLLPYSNNSGVASHGILLFSSVVYIDSSASKYIYSSKTVTRSRIRMNEVANLFFFNIKFFTQHHHYCFWQYHVHYVLKCTKLHKERKPQSSTESNSARSSPRSSYILTFTFSPKKVNSSFEISSNCSFVIHLIEFDSNFSWSSVDQETHHHVITIN